MIKTVLILLIAALFVFVLLNILYKHTNAYYNGLIPYQALMNSVPTDIGFACFGSTYSLYAFGQLDEFNMNAFNFSGPAQSLEIDSALLHKFSGNLEEGAIVIFCLASCVSFYRYEMAPNKALYYKFLKPKEIPSYSLFDHIRCVFPLLGGNLLKKCVGIYINKSRKDSIYDLYSVETEVESDMNMKAMAEGWKKLFHLKDLKEQNTEPVNVINRVANTKLLHGMLNFCIEHKFIPFIVIPPFSARLNNYFGIDFINSSLWSLIEDAINGLNVKVLDYRQSAELQNNLQCYSDGGYRLSEKGSRMFIKKVLEDIKVNKEY